MNFLRNAARKFCTNVQNRYNSAHNLYSAASGLCVEVYHRGLQDVLQTSAVAVLPSGTYRWTKAYLANQEAGYGLVGYSKGPAAAQQEDNEDDDYVMVQVVESSQATTLADQEEDNLDEDDYVLLNPHNYSDVSTPLEIEQEYEHALDDIDDFDMDDLHEDDYGLLDFVEDPEAEEVEQVDEVIAETPSPVKCVGFRQGTAEPMLAPLSSPMKEVMPMEDLDVFLQHVTSKEELDRYRQVVIQSVFMELSRLHFTRQIDRDSDLSLQGAWRDIGGTLQTA